MKASPLSGLLFSTLHKVIGKACFFITYLLLPGHLLGWSNGTLAQSNDNCEDAIPLNVGSTCSISVFSNNSATSESEGVAADPSCGQYQGADVWFTAEMPASGALRIETDNLASSVAHSIVIYEGECGDFTEVLCVQLDHEKTIYNPLLVGQILYIRMFSYSNPNGSPFELCVWEPVIPENDNCESAAEIVMSENCIPKIFNSQATTQPVDVAPDPSCGAYQGGDVWFKTVVPASGDLRVETDNLWSSTPLSIVVYSGACGNFMEAVCSELDDAESFFVPDLAGQTVYIRVYNFGTEEGGDFSFCVFEPSKPENDNCELATELIIGETCVPKLFSKAYATIQPIDVAPDPSCGAYQGGDVWFKAVVPASGDLRIETDNLWSATPLSIAIYTGSCESFVEVACSELDDAESFFVPDLAGQTVYIRVYSFGTEEGGDFSFCVFEPSKPENDDCGSATDIVVGESCEPQLFSTVYATTQSIDVAPDPSCGAYQGGDVWFRTVVPVSGKVRVEANNLWSATPLSMAVYTGACGNFVEVACSELDEARSFFAPHWVGQTVYFRIYNFGTEEGGGFELCMYDSGCADQSVEAGTISICEGDSYIFGTQILTEPGQYSELFTSVGGCDSLVNLTLDLYPVYNLTHEGGICSGSSFTFPDGTILDNIRSDTIHTSVFSTIHGCDSLLVTDLKVLTEYRVEETIAVCEGENYTFPDGSIIDNITSDTVYTSAFTSTYHCDSIVKTILNTRPVYHLEESVSVCKAGGYTFPDGTRADSIVLPVTHTSYLATADQCDSVIVTSINVEEVDISVLQVESTLSANADSARYQWINCVEGSVPIRGETGKTFVAVEGGEYAVMITKNSCMAVSDCHSVSIADVVSDSPSSIKIYPNPVSAILNIELPDTYKSSAFRLLDTKGVELFHAPVQATLDFTLDMNSIRPGLYVLLISAEEEVAAVKIIKE